MSAQNSVEFAMGEPSFMRGVQIASGVATPLA